MARDTHFEVFFKKNRKAGWTLIEALEARDAAVDKAKALIKQHPEGSARVTKEEFDEKTRVFRAFTVFEAGGEKYEDDGRADKKVELACQGPADLITPHAREAISRALRGWLTRQTCVTLELLHRTDLVERLEATGTEMQHAVQKIAIANASQSAASAQHFVKQINALVQKAVEALYAEARAGETPKLKEGELAAFARAHAAASGRERRLRASLAQRLKGSTSWREKLERVLSVAHEAAAAGDDAAWTRPIIGEFVGEVVAIEAACECLIETPGDLGVEVDVLAAIISGERDGLHASASPRGARLAQLFAADQARDARVVLSRRILRVLLSPKRLKPSDVHAEVELTRELAERLVHSSSGLISHAEIAEAFVARSGRLLQSDAVEAFLEPAGNPGAEALALISLEDNIVGEHNKAKLAAYLRAHLGAHAFERYMRGGEGSITARLAELAGLKRQVDASGFSAKDTSEIGDLIDRSAADAIQATDLFTRIEERAMPALDRAHALVKLAAMGGLPSGPVAQDAAKRAMALVRSAGGREEAATASGGVTLKAIIQCVEQISAAPQRAA